MHTTHQITHHINNWSLSSSFHSLYYRLALSYAPADLQLRAASYGFQIRREYEAVQSAAGEKLTAEALNEALKVDPAGVVCIKSVSVSVSVNE